MRWFLLLLACAWWSACNFLPWAEPECMERSPQRLAAGPFCDHEVESAMSFPEIQMEHMKRWEFPPEALAVVTEVEGGRVQVRHERLGRTILWPNPLPFPVEVGETVVIQADPTSTTLYFEQGALAFHAVLEGRWDPRERQRIGSLEAHWEQGCVATDGQTLDLVVGGERIRPGESAEVQGWRVKNFGALAGGVAACDGETMSPHRAFWIAESTEEGLKCDRSPPPSTVCDEALVAANTRGQTLRPGFSGGNVRPGEHRVLGVHDEGFSFSRPDDPTILHFTWSGPLPFEVEEGDLLVVDRRDLWDVLTLPGGELAVANLVGFTLSVPSGSPDFMQQMWAVEGCGVDGAYAIHGVGFRDEEAVLMPGEELTVGDWTYSLLSTKQIGGGDCRQGPRTLMIVEGMAEGRLIAYRSGAATDAPSR